MLEKHDSRHWVTLDTTLRESTELDESDGTPVAWFLSHGSMP